jgi:exonuclease V gamma subunit
VVATPTEVIDLADLQAFFNDPVAAFATSSVQMAFPRTVDVDDVILPVEPGPLEYSALGRRLLEARWKGITTREWLTVERRVGTLPPGALEARSMEPIESEVDGLLAEAQRLGVRMGEPEIVELDVVLDDHTRIVGAVPLLLPEETPGPAWVRFTRTRPSFTLDAWLHLSALTVSDPGRPWRSVFVSRGTGGDPVAVVDLVVPGAGDEQSALARSALDVAVACFRAGMLEPLPLFPKFSKSVADGTPRYSDWSGSRGAGDRTRPATEFFYGQLSGSELLAIEGVAGDPGSSGGRVARWAEYLWGAVGGTSREFGS